MRLCLWVLLGRLVQSICANNYAPQRVQQSGEHINRMQKRFFFLPCGSQKVFWSTGAGEHTDVPPSYVVPQNRMGPALKEKVKKISEAVTSAAFETMSEGIPPKVIHTIPLVNHLRVCRGCGAKMLWHR